MKTPQFMPPLKYLTHLDIKGQLDGCTFEVGSDVPTGLNITHK